MPAIKLKRVKKNPEVDKMYTCCRYCHYCYVEGGTFYCGNSPVQSSASDDFEHLVEEGVVEEVIKESFVQGFPKQFNSLESLFKSKKKLEEFKELFSECLEEYIEDCTETIEESLMYTVLNKLGAKSSQVIENPYNYYCERYE